MIKMLLVSNMFPSEEFPSYGTFVKKTYDQQVSLGYCIEKSVLYKKRNNKLMQYYFFYKNSFKKLIKNRYDVVYIHYISHSSLPVVLLPKKYCIISNIHGSDIMPKGKFKKILEIINKRIVRKSNLIVVPTIYYKEVIIKKFKVENERVFVSPSGGIDFSVFNNKMRSKKRKEKFVIGFAGRLEPEKGWKTLVDAVDKLNIDNLELHIVGNGSDEEFFEQYIKDKKSNFTIKKWDSLNQIELADFYRSLDCFVFPTENQTESLGLVGLEAMASGCFLIASNHPAILTYLNNGENGFTFEMGNIHSLRDTILKLYNLSDEDREKIKKMALKTSKQYDEKLVAEKLDKKIKEMILCKETNF